MEGCFTFLWGEGGGLFFRWVASVGVHTIGGIGFDWRVFKKDRRMGEAHHPHSSPLWETLGVIILVNRFFLTETVYLISEI